MLQPCPRKLRPIELAEVLMKLAGSVVIEQHIGKLLEVVEPTNLGLGTPDAAAVIVRVVRGWASDIALAPKSDTDGDVIMPIDLENASCGRAFCSTCLEAAGLACPPLAATCAAQWESTQDSDSDAMTDGWPTPPCEAVGRAQKKCS